MRPLTWVLESQEKLAVALPEIVPTIAANSVPNLLGILKYSRRTKPAWSGGVPFPAENLAMEKGPSSDLIRGSNTDFSAAPTRHGEEYP